MRFKFNTTKSAIAFIAVATLLLAGCGGGSGSSNNAVAGAPTFGGVILSTVNNTDQVTIAWLDAQDSTTPAAQIKYNIYVSTTQNFTPSSANLKQTVTGVKQAVINGLTAGTTYYVLVQAINNSGAIIPGGQYATFTTSTLPVTLSTTNPIINAKSAGLTPPTVVGTDYHYPNTANVTPPQPGSILVGNDAAGGYYLRKVVGSSIAGNEMVVQTTDGSLTDAVTQGAISNTIKLFDTSTTTPATVVGVVSNGVSSKLEWQNNLLKFEEITNPNKPAGLFIERNNQTGHYLISTVPPVNRPVGVMTGSVTDSLNYDVGITYTPNLVTDIQWSSGLTGLKILKADVTASGTLSFDAKAMYNFTATGSFTKDYAFDVFKRTWVSVYTVGTVPVYQEITFTLGAHMQANALAAIQANAAAHASETITFGVHYNPSTGAWEPVATPSNSQSLTADMSLQGKVTSEIRLIPNVEVKFYKVAAANMSVEPVVAGNIQMQGVANANFLTGYFPPAITQLTAFDATLGVQCFVGANLQILTSTLPLLSKTQVCNVPVYNIYSLPSLALSSTFQSNGTYVLTASVTDGNNNPFNDVSIKWVVYPKNAGILQPNGRQATFTPAPQSTAGNNATIFFSGYGKLGEIGRQFAQVQVPLPTLTLTPANSTVTPGSSVQLTATAKDSSGNLFTLPPGLTWTSNNAGVTVSNTGLVTATTTATGSATITVTDPASGTKVSTTVNVTTPVLSIVPANPSVSPGSSIMLTVSAKDSMGNPITLPTGLTWLSNNTGITISNPGQVTSLAQVTAAANASGSATITVTDPASGATANVTVTVQGCGASFVTQGGLTWMPTCYAPGGATRSAQYPGQHWYTWSEANAYCTGTAINGLTGWRLPTVQELAGLVSETVTFSAYPMVTGIFNNSALINAGWTVGSTWSSTPTIAGGHFNVILSFGVGVVGGLSDTSISYVTCVR